MFITAHGTLKRCLVKSDPFSQKECEDGSPTNMTTASKIGRRQFLSRTGFAGALLATAPWPLKAAVFGRRRLKVAAVVTEFTYHSHAHVILENFVEPYLFNGKWISPGMDLVSLYVDQFPAGELG